MVTDAWNESLSNQPIMKTTSEIAGTSELRIFTGIDNQNDSPDLSSQLPFIENLFEQFESVTGWTLGFQESRFSRQNRAKDDQSTFFGELKIEDMSNHIETGRSARHRGFCDQLTQTLDCMVHMIQADRQRFRSIQQHLSPAVEVPFDWWSISGNVGYRKGSFSSWSVSQEQKIRAFAGRVIGDDLQSSVLSSATILALFDTACKSPFSLEQIAPLVSVVKQRSSMFDARLDWFATVELDPITGEYELDGYDATKGVALIDVQAATVLDLKPDELDGTLYSGQILAIGMTDEVKQRIEQLISASELTVNRLCDQIQKEFDNETGLFLYRN